MAPLLLALSGHVVALVVTITVSAVGVGVILGEIGASLKR